MELRHDSEHPHTGRRAGGLIEELRRAAGRLTDDQRDRLIHHLDAEAIMNHEPQEPSTAIVIPLTAEQRDRINAFLSEILDHAEEADAD